MYCEISDVETFLPPNIITEDDAVGVPNPLNPSPVSLTRDDITGFIRHATRNINSAIATIYDTPLKKTNQGGTVSFPDPIITITAILTAQMIFEQRLQGVDRQRSESVKEKHDWAEEQLASIQNGELRLVGQRCTRGSRFVRGTLPNIPRNPAEGGRTKGISG